MTARTIQVAEAVVAELNAGGYVPRFTAVRKYAPVWTLEELATLRVCVVPAARETSLADRSHNDEEIAIDVGVQQRVPEDDNTLPDQLLDLAEQIGDGFLGHRLPTMPTAMVMAVAHKSLFAPEHLHQMRVFTSILTLTVKVMP